MCDNYLGVGMEYKHTLSAFSWKIPAAQPGIHAGLSQEELKNWPDLFAWSSLVDRKDWIIFKQALKYFEALLQKRDADSMLFLYYSEFTEASF